MLGLYMQYYTIDTDTKTNGPLSAEATKTFVVIAGILAQRHCTVPLTPNTCALTHLFWSVVLGTPTGLTFLPTPVAVGM